MPELPEVETIRRELRPNLVGKRIIGVRVFRRDIIGYPKARSFRARLTGNKIAALKRRGKYLIIQLKNRATLILHLRLSGQLLLIKSSSSRLRFERLRFNLSGGKALAFVEPRVLGRAYFFRETENPAPLKGFFNLGLEPIMDRFDKNYLKSKLNRRKAKIKDLLLDQSIAAGVGNIYSDEALYLAKIHPLRPGNTLTDPEIARLTQSLRKVLEDGIRALGSSFSDYRRPDGREGNYQNRTRVFGQEGNPCRRCRTKIEITKVGNRRTRFCPRCQK
jgi:formamidopyrimidine-DNA glycosylase